MLREAPSDKILFIFIAVLIVYTFLNYYFHNFYIINLYISNKSKTFLQQLVEDSVEQQRFSCPTLFIIFHLLELMKLIWMKKHLAIKA